jgi:hypothetical protein
VGAREYVLRLCETCPGGSHYGEDEVGEGHDGGCGRASLTNTFAPQRMCEVYTAINGQS